MTACGRNTPALILHRKNYIMTILKVPPEITVLQFVPTKKVAWHMKLGILILMIQSVLFLKQSERINHRKIPSLIPMSTINLVVKKTDKF